MAVAIIYPEPDKGWRVSAKRSAGDGGGFGRTLAVENLGGGPPSAKENISGRVALHGQLAVRCKYGKLFYD
jgi:hypothetical protein